MHGHGIFIIYEKQHHFFKQATVVHTICYETNQLNGKGGFNKFNIS